MANYKNNNPVLFDLYTSNKKIEEERKVYDGIIGMGGLPDSFKGVSVKIISCPKPNSVTPQPLVENKYNPIPSKDEFYIDYKHGWLHLNMYWEGSTVRLEFESRGIELTPASRIYYVGKDGKMDVSKTLQDFIDEINSVTFTEASKVENIESGDNFSTIFGKISKWYNDKISKLKNLAFKDKVETSDIQDKAVTEAKIANNSISSTKIRNSAVTWDKLNSDIADIINSHATDIEELNDLNAYYLAHKVSDYVYFSPSIGKIVTIVNDTDNNVTAMPTAGDTFWNFKKNNATFTLSPGKAVMFQATKVPQAGADPINGTLEFVEEVEQPFLLTTGGTLTGDLRINGGEDNKLAFGGNYNGKDVAYISTNNDDDIKIYGNWVVLQTRDGNLTLAHDGELTLTSEYRDLLNAPIATLNDLNEKLNTKVDKESGKGLSTNDYTTAEKNKLAGIAENANNYTHPSSHAASMITQDSEHRFVTDNEKNKLETIDRIDSDLGDISTDILHIQEYIDQIKKDIALAKKGTIEPDVSLESVRNGEWYSFSQS